MNERSIFMEALAREGAERSAYLAEACGGDAALLKRVEALLESHEQAGTFLAKPVAERLAEKQVVGGEATSGSYTAAEPENSVRPGTVIGPYKLLQQIGEGGMGTVFMAEQTEPVQRKVALKLIKPGLDSRQVIARFEAERQALALMDHPNIAKVLDAGTTGQISECRMQNADFKSEIANLQSASGAGRPYFVMELVKGVPITKYCDEHHLTPRERLELFVPVCQAVQHAHQKGIIHRDIKPSNVMVCLYDGRPVPKVIDFGVAKAAGPKLTERTLFTELGQVVGTLEYMSPEQAELNQLDVDTRSDIYSLGVLLYELLTGTTPLERGRLKQAAFLEVLRLIREEEPPRPSTRLSTTEELPSIAANRGLEPKKLSGLVRGELDWIVMKALEKGRDRRYESANALAMDVQRYLSDEAVQACPPSATYRLRKFARKHKGTVLTIAAVAATFLSGLAASLWQWSRAEWQWSRAEKRAEGERIAKLNALAAAEAESKALASERQAREHAMAALRVMTDDFVEHQLARAPKLTEDNKELLRKIIKHFEGFAALTADDAESRAIRAEGFFRVGLMRVRLGELKEAEAAYTEALAIRKQLAADFPSRPDFRQQLAWSHNNLGNLLKNTGRLKAAEMSFTEAVALQKQLAVDFPARPELSEQLGWGLNNLGVFFFTSGRLKEAETAWSDALTVFKRLAADFPARPEVRRGLASSHNNLGNLFSNTGQPKEAEAAYTEGIAILKPLIADFSNSLELRQDLARGYNNLAALFRSAGRLKDAEMSFTDAVSVLKPLASEFPTRPEPSRELAWSYYTLSLLRLDTGRWKEAEPSIADALAIQKRLIAEHPDRPEFRKDLAATYTSLGRLFQTAGRLNEAEKANADALVIQKQLVADFPARIDFQNDVAGSFVNLALVCNQRRAFKEAKAYLEGAVPYHQAALQANSRHPQHRQFFQFHLHALVHANAGLHDQATALGAAEKFRDLGWNAPGNAYDAACALSLCIPIVEKDGQLDVAKRQAAVQFYGQQAMAMLRAAVEKGFKNAAHMKRDTDLDPLRQRDDFKKLVAELEAGGGKK
jgi:serine/threonine protein kinase